MRQDVLNAMNKADTAHAAPSPVEQGVLKKIV